MTTVVFDKKRNQIAIDSRLTANDTIMDDNGIKYLSINGDMWFFSGDYSDYYLLAEHYYSKPTSGKKTPSCGALVVTKNNVIQFGVLEGKRAQSIKTEFNDAIGSGAWWALAALDHGKTAKQAVEYAKTRDCYTGGKVHVFDIDKNKFVRG